MQQTLRILSADSSPTRRRRDSLADDAVFEVWRLCREQFVPFGGDLAEPTVSVCLLALSSALQCSKKTLVSTPGSARQCRIYAGPLFALSSWRSSPREGLDSKSAARPQRRFCENAWGSSSLASEHAESGRCVLLGCDPKRNPFGTGRACACAARRGASSL